MVGMGLFLLCGCAAVSSSERIDTHIGQGCTVFVQKDALPNPVTQNAPPGAVSGKLVSVSPGWVVVKVDLNSIGGTPVQGREHVWSEVWIPRSSVVLIQF